MNLSELIKSSRKKLLLQQRELAQKIGVTPAAISYWEAGKREPSGTVLIKLAEVLGIVSDLFPGYVKSCEQQLQNLVSRTDPPVDDAKIAALERKLAEMRSTVDQIQSSMASIAKQIAKINSSNLQCQVEEGDEEDSLPREPRN